MDQSMLTKINLRTADINYFREFSATAIVGSQSVRHDCINLADTGDLKVHSTKEYMPSSIEVMYGRESWTVKKAEHRRIDAFEL